MFDPVWDLSGTPQNEGFIGAQNGVYGGPIGQQKMIDLFVFFVF